MTVCGKVPGWPWETSRPGNRPRGRGRPGKIFGSHREVPDLQRFKEAGSWPGRQAWEGSRPGMEAREASLRGRLGMQPGRQVSPGGRLAQEGCWPGCCKRCSFRLIFLTFDQYDTTQYSLKWQLGANKPSGWSLEWMWTSYACCLAAFSQNLTHPNPGKGGNVSQIPA